MIPGHGGIMDRFDCQFLMATFVNVYISSFIRVPSPQKLLNQVFNLKPEQQLALEGRYQEVGRMLRGVMKRYDGSGKGASSLRAYLARI